MMIHPRTFSLFAALLFSAHCFGAGEIPTASFFTNAFDRAAFAFAQDFCERAVKGNITVDEVVDMNALAARSLAGTRTSAKLRDEMEGGLRKGFAVTFLESLQRARNLRPLSIRRQGVEVRVVIRVMTPDRGHNYIELLCQGRPGGQVRAVDVFNWTTGEYISETMRRVLQMTQQQSLSPLDRLAGKDDPNVQLLQAINEMNRLSAAGDWQGVLQRYAQLPPKLQREKVFALLRARAAGKVDQAEYMEALKFWQVNFPHDPSIELISFDAVYFQKKYDVALQVTDRLDRNVGGDPFLDLVRAGLYIKLGQPEQAKAHAQEAVRREPELAKFMSSDLLRMASVSRPTANAGTSPNAKAGTSKLRLQGIFLRNDRSSAVIGGETVYEGDTLDGLQVVKIEKSRVTLQSSTGELRSLTFD